MDPPPRPPQPRAPRKVFETLISWALPEAVDPVAARERGAALVRFGAELLVVAPPAAGLEERFSALTAPLSQQHWIWAVVRRAKVVLPCRPPPPSSGVLLSQGTCGRPRGICEAPK